MIRVTLHGFEFSIEGSVVTAKAEELRFVAESWNEQWEFALRSGQANFHDDKDLAFARHLQARLPELQIDLSDHEGVDGEDGESLY
jgi:hypothetical protein